MESNTRRLSTAVHAQRSEFDKSSVVLSRQKEREVGVRREFSQGDRKVSAQRDEVTKASAERDDVNSRYRSRSSDTDRYHDHVSGQSSSDESWTLDYTVVRSQRACWCGKQGENDCLKVENLFGTTRDEDSPQCVPTRKSNRTETSHLDTEPACPRGNGEVLRRKAYPQETNCLVCKTHSTFLRNAL